MNDRPTYLDILEELRVMLHRSNRELLASMTPRLDKYPGYPGFLGTAEAVEAWHRKEQADRELLEVLRRNLPRRDAA